MRGLEPPPGCPDTDLNRARLPIPPHPRVGEEANIASARAVAVTMKTPPARRARERLGEPTP
jgi:hypothetical protein